MKLFKRTTTDTVSDAEKPMAKFRRAHRHPVGLALIVFVALVLFGSAALYLGLRNHATELTITPNENFIVIVKADGAERTVPTAADTVGELLDKLDITLAKGDRVEPAQTAPITGDNFLINVYRSVPVAINDGGAVTVTHSAAATARSIVKQAGVSLYGEDIVKAEVSENFLLERGFGQQLVITRAKPVSLTLYGQPLPIRTQATTVRDLLKQKGVKLTEKDTVKPDVDTPITPGMQVAVIRDGLHVVTVTEEIPAPVKTVVDSSLSFGSQAVRQQGSAGKIVKTYQIKIENGDEVDRALLQSVVTVEPVTRIVAQGNTVNIPANKQAVLAAAGVSPGDYGYVDYIFSRESHWNAAAASANGYYGLGQTSLGKLSAACPNWQNDPVCQTRLFTSYATGRYGSWSGAYNFWLSHHWW